MNSIFLWFLNWLSLSFLSYAPSHFFVFVFVFFVCAFRDATLNTGLYAKSCGNGKPLEAGIIRSHQNSLIEEFQLYLQML